MSLLDQVRKLEQQVTDRLKELEPLTREYDQLRRLAERLGLKYSPGSTADTDAQPAPSKRGAATRTRAKGQPGRAPAKARSARPSGRARAATSDGAQRSDGQRAADGAQGAGSSATSAPRRARRSASTRAQRPGGRRASTARPGQRDEDVLRLAGENPGITVREIAERLGVDATGLYRVVKRQTDDGRLRKEGPRLHRVEPAATPSPAPEAAAADTSASDALAEVLEETASSPSDSSQDAADAASTDDA